MGRLDKQLEQELTPKRAQYAREQLQALGIQITSTQDTPIVFQWKQSTVTFYPYSGWHTGKTIKDGRGIHKLLKQLKK